MKKKLCKLVSTLATIASIGFVIFVIQKILNGNAFERSRTVWLYETDYFSDGKFSYSSVTQDEYENR